MHDPWISIYVPYELPDLPADVPMQLTAMIQGTPCRSAGGRDVGYFNAHFLQPVLTPSILYNMQHQHMVPRKHRLHDFFHAHDPAWDLPEVLRTAMTSRSGGGASHNFWHGPGHVFGHVFGCIVSNTPVGEETHAAELAYCVQTAGMLRVMYDRVWTPHTQGCFCILPTARIML